VSDLVGPELLADQHVIDSFDCGDEPLDEWLARRARRNQIEGASRTWVITDDTDVIAYYASSTAVVLRSESTKRAARNQPDPLPALLLSRLAVDQRWQGHGLGAALLKHFILKAVEVAQITGVRVLLVHAKNPEAAAFYTRYGFEPSPIDDLTLMLLMKDVTRQ
jgi:GNAT superfamily N-acetyltransferase